MSQTVICDYCEKETKNYYIAHLTIKNFKFKLYECKDKKECQTKFTEDEIIKRKSCVLITGVPYSQLKYIKSFKSVMIYYDEDENTYYEYGKPFDLKGANPHTWYKIQKYKFRYETRGLPIDRSVIDPLA